MIFSLEAEPREKVDFPPRKSFFYVLDTVRGVLCELGCSLAARRLFDPSVKEFLFLVRAVYASLVVLANSPLVSVTTGLGRRFSSPELEVL